MLHQIWTCQVNWVDDLTTDFILNQQTNGWFCLPSNYSDKQSQMKLWAPKINKSSYEKKHQLNFAQWQSNIILAKATVQNKTLSWFMCVITSLAKIVIHSNFTTWWRFFAHLLFVLSFFRFISLNNMGGFDLYQPNRIWKYEWIELTPSDNGSTTCSA